MSYFCDHLIVVTIELRMIFVTNIRTTKSPYMTSIECFLDPLVMRLLSKNRNSKNQKAVRCCIVSDSTIITVLVLITITF